MKVIDKMNESIKAGKTFFSFEFFPPRTDEVGFVPFRWFSSASSFPLHLPGSCRTVLKHKPFLQ